MIAAGELQPFVPFGREHCQRHPSAVNLQLRQLQPAPELWCSDGAAGLVGSLQEVSLQEREKESWQLRKGSASALPAEAEYEEELYVAGHMVIWSRGTKSQASYVYKAFTVDSPVQQALWCNFIVPHSRKEEKDIREHSVCIVQSTCVNVHSVSGKDFISPLPFQVSFFWPTKYGLLIERKSVSSDAQLSPLREPLPTLFSMLHPLDEIAPVVSKSTGLFEMQGLQYVSDSTLRVVFSCAEPSIIMTYDTLHCGHTVWVLRKVTPEEQSAVLKCPSQDGPARTPTAAPTFLGTHLRSMSRLDSPASPLHCHALHNQSRVPASPALHSRTHSPNISNMAALSRAHSPGMAAPSFTGAHRFNMSCHSPSARGHSLLTSPNSTMNETALLPEMEPILPDLCIEQLWTETTSSYRCVKFLESNETSQLIFASVISIPAKDAAPLEDIDALLVLEANGSLVLYTGVTRVSKVFVPGLLSPTFSLPNSLPNLNNPLENVSTPAKATVQHMSRLEESDMPSPVSEMRTVQHHESSWLEDSPFQQTTLHIQALRDPVGNRLTLELSSGSMLRITVPEVSTSELVKRCLQAIRFILPKDTAMKVLVKWYNMYNAPGGPSMHQEWNLFVTCLMTLMGYSTERLAWTRNLHFEVPLSPVIAPKKARPADTGSDEDWTYLSSSDYHCQVSVYPAPGMSGLNVDTSAAIMDECGPATGIEPSALLFTHIPALFYVLHLLYEDLKLDELQRSGARALVGLLQQMARDLQQEEYIDLYWRDYPSFIKSFKETCKMDQAQMELMSWPTYLNNDVPCVFAWLSSCLRGQEMPPFPYLPGICERTRLIVLSYALYIVGDEQAALSNMSKYLSRLSAGQKKGFSEPALRRQSSVKQSFPTGCLAEKLVVWLTSEGFMLKDLESVPFGVALPIRDAIIQCREHPCSDWSEEVCALIGRQDLTKQAHKVSLAKGKPMVALNESLESPITSEAEEEEDGMADLHPEVTGLIWSRDLRVQEVRRLLQSSRPVRVNVPHLPEVSDHEYIEEKENKLLQLCQRTMALPVGRGLFTLFSYHPVPTEPLPVPKLNLTGRAPPRNTTVDLNSGNVDVPPNMANWPSFHNGVAAGLKIAPASRVESAWIAYNKPKNLELAYEYAGFLMALGLNGHLTKLATLNIHDYLTKGHEMTCIGLLLGVSAAKMGTMDMSVTRLLSIHVPALLPPTSTELDVPHSVQVAAVVGIGLVYQGTGHRHNAEVLLAEIGRPPGPEMEYCTDRESYSLAAGLALGMVCLGHGSNLIGMTDLNVPEQLYQYMVGGHRRAHTGVNREKHKSPSYQIKTLARCLIMWDEILPNEEWVTSNVPQIIQENIGLQEEALASEDLNMETLVQAHDYIIAGACMAVGFRFAGSANSDAFDCLSGQYNLQTCLSMVLLATSMVMAGSGNLKVIQLCRFLHKRTFGEMNYGFHMAHHMALGLLFLGGGRYTLGTSNSAIAALLCALYPHFPAHSTDNRYHLQALRHLCVLAAEPRLLVPVDVDTLKPCYALLDITYKETQWYEETTVELMAPAMLPELHLLKQIKVKGPRYWELNIDLMKGTQHLQSILSRDGVLYVKLRAGQLPYKDDPRGWKSLLAPSANRNPEVRKFKPEAISTLTSDTALVSFAKYFCEVPENIKDFFDPQKQDTFALYAAILYECVTQENPEMLPTHISIDQVVKSLQQGDLSETFSLWQLKLVLELCESGVLQRRLQDVCRQRRGLLLSSEFLPVMKSSADQMLDRWLSGNKHMLQEYITRMPTTENLDTSLLACFLVYHSIPSFKKMATADLEGKHKDNCKFLLGIPCS
ncbi:Anaphase-promoting complex subunit 1 [Bagarius yarrelli]|uniref:Anaphase-promoting complex subunit 1 n=1 Tax=Bagarius yarrelli TaxID=175774 RepID=A0A556U709_BAGYA|nr:Anaphase-promoting complex subunit 1 [Bagarius yarrelli]